MALTSEDKGDVKRHFGKALANKVSRVTRDKPSQSRGGAKYLDTKASLRNSHPAYDKFRYSSDEIVARSKTPSPAKSKALSMKQRIAGGEDIR